MRHPRPSERPVEGDISRRARLPVVLSLTRMPPPAVLRVHAWSPIWSASKLDTGQSMNAIVRAMTAGRFRLPKWGPRALPGDDSPGRKAVAADRRCAPPHHTWTGHVALMAASLEDRLS